ncbi:MAG TPA: DUF2285 domain-containing protein [Allosphingosinicella sp.]
MHSGEHFRPDWRDEAAYRPLLAADRSLLAWEWLRRDKGYRGAAAQAVEEGEAGRLLERPERWGLHAFEPPDLAVPDGRPVWCGDVDPHVLAVRARPGAGDDVLDLERLAPLCRLLSGEADRQHLLICDGLRSIRIDVVEGKIQQGRIHLEDLIAGFDQAEKPLLAVRRLLALRRTGRFSTALHPPQSRAGRFVLTLRAWDALASGATQREIAAWLLDEDAQLGRWRVRAPSLRSRAQRLARSARRMAAGGYRALLAG